MEWNTSGGRAKTGVGTLIPYEHQYLRRPHQDLRRWFDEAFFGEYERRV